ncbi:unnamed protein product [Nippostrongylus brasiliensis]|uniref:Mitochondrial protein M19 n=1 Tax=Nippostrongylus brasiliensis TaxID=27835 RepID=A0A158R303_NIPBR|nr:hypothetical protein Q1695_005740 [Nippostrongylus brasiliensis]VDL80884.1 unnamed protein product [Nippostrongylus brasiliensis]
MSKYLYKQYVRLVARWPKDEFKGPDRDLAMFLSREVERQFVAEPATIDVGQCERRYRALEQISSNTTARLFPHQYKSGVFGLNLQQLQDANSDENRKQFGLGREGVLKRLWKAVFPPKQNASR